MKPDEHQSDGITCLLGLDVGGTKIAAGLVAFPSGRVLLKRIIPTQPQRGGEAVLTDALELARSLMAEAETQNLPVSGIGVGVCELVDRQGQVTSAHQVDWRDLPVQATFSELAPAVVESDARAPALAEAIFGAGRPFNLFTYITVGTGISYCLVQEGRPYAGARGNALVLASSPLSTTCTHCGTRLEPILEEFASGPALVTRYSQAREGEGGFQSALQGVGLEGGLKSARPAETPVTRGEEVLAAVEAGDPVATAVVQSAGEALGVSVGWLVNVLDPEAVIVGGGLGSAGGLYWESFVAAARQHIWSEAGRDLPIIPADLGPDAGFIGAAATAWKEKVNRDE